MKIKFLRDAKYPQNDPENSREYKAGEVYDVDRDHALRWIRRNAAVEADDDKPAARRRIEAMVPAPPAKSGSV